MMLSEAKKDFTSWARLLPMKYEEYDINDLADNYCKAIDNKDEHNKNVYCSALILRFWYTIDRMFRKCRGADVDHNDMLGVLFDCINTACYYRAWQKPERHTNAQACINQVLASRGVPAIIYESNLKKNIRPVASLDSVVDEDSGATLLDLIADDLAEDPATDEDLQANWFVQNLINKNKIVEAIIADNIAFKDVFKHEKKTVEKVNVEGKTIKTVEHTSTFWPFRVVQELNNLNTEYVNYFLKKYKITPEKFNVAYNMLEKANNQKKYKILRSTLSTLKTTVQKSEELSLR